jgi:cyanophycinase
MQPVFLLADSQLLFVKNEKQEYYLKIFLAGILPRKPKCAYIGISNGDDPQFYQLFYEAMKIIDAGDCKMITSIFSADEREFLDNADLILLAGGDTERGLDVFRQKGIVEVLQRKYRQGTIFIGVSAGAIQLGWLSFQKMDLGKYKATEALKFVPFIIITHAAEKNFEEVKVLLAASDTIKRVYEIPAGAGLIYYPDNTIDAIRKPVNEFIQKDDELLHTFIFPTVSNS